MLETRSQIIRNAFDLFSQYGIKSVSMDDIARSSSISKRTLYSFFEDKETLLVEGREYINGQLAVYLNELEQSSLTSVDIILLFFDELLKRPRWYSRKFYDDMKRYPKMWQEHEEEKREFTEKCMQLFERGAKEGVFRDEINFEIMALLSKEQLKMIHPSKMFSKHSNLEVFGTILVIFLRGISTEKGCAILDKWIATKKIQQQIH